MSNNNYFGGNLNPYELKDVSGKQPAKLNFNQQHCQVGYGNQNSSRVNADGDYSRPQQLYQPQYQPQHQLQYQPQTINQLNFNPNPNANVIQCYPQNQQPNFQNQNYQSQSHPNQFNQQMYYNSKNIHQATTGLSFCNPCNKNSQTIVKQKNGSFVWLMCLLLFIFTGCLCCIPFCVHGWKDKEFRCVKCSNIKFVEKGKC